MTDESRESGSRRRLVTRRRLLWGGAAAGAGLASLKIGSILSSRFQPDPPPVSTGAAPDDPYACARFTAWSRSESGGTDVFETGEFPFGPRTHNLGWAYMFDIAVMGTILDCRPGDRVLDIGAGSGPTNETLVRFGYDTVAVDPDQLALSHGLRRLHFDRRLRPDHGSAVAGIAERLPFRDGTFDGILGMNVLHHVDDLAAAAREFARVLKPGRRAAFCEPGTRHLEAAATRNTMRETHADERAFDVRAFADVALASGFRNAQLAPYLYPYEAMFPVGALDEFAAGPETDSPLHPANLARSSVERRALFVLVRQGERARDSRYPGHLACQIAVERVPSAARPGETIAVRVRVRNVGDTLWLSKPHEYGGYVTFGVKLVHPDGRVISDSIGRTPMPHDVAAGGAVEGVLHIRLPADLASGDYALTFDMVDEWVGWFSRAAERPLPVYPVRVS
jgi:SAM-dependent methyltransferase